MTTTVQLVPGGLGLPLDISVVSVAPGSGVARVVGPPLSAASEYPTGFFELNGVLFDLIRESGRELVPRQKLLVSWGDRELPVLGQARVPRDVAALIRILVMALAIEGPRSTPDARRLSYSEARAVAEDAATSILEKVMVPRFGSPPQDLQTLTQAVMKVGPNSGAFSGVLVAMETGHDSPLALLIFTASGLVLVNIALPVTRAIGRGIEKKIDRFFGV